MSIFRKDHMVHAMNDCAGCVLGGGAGMCGVGVVWVWLF